MITNIPTSHELENISLRLHFSAWADLLSVVTDFNEVFEPSEEDPSLWAEEQAEYSKAYQPELQSICAVIQQSNELALKARICAISPYLLLLNAENKLSTYPKNLEFFSLRTLDAIDLPSTTNTFCPTPLSDKFIQEYNSTRALRNSVLHAGRTGKAFNANKLLHTLIFFYHELWPERKWLADRVKYASQTRLAFFHDGRWSSAHAVVMNELADTFAIFTNHEFKLLFKKSKSKRRYVCHHCLYEATTKGGRPDPDICQTAWLDDDRHLTCQMCAETFKVDRRPCNHLSCRGNAIGDNDDNYVGVCHTCGEEQ